jgi:NADP-dependent 3-hydroxy acid dehydrogenase YdfG
MVNSSFFKKLKFSPGKNIKNSIKLADIAELVFFILKSNRNINYNDIYLSPIKKVINFKNN